MDEPAALCQSLRVTAERLVVDVLLQPVHVLDSQLPVLHQNLRRQLSPQTVQIVLIVGRHQHFVQIQALGGTAVVAYLVVELGELVHRVHHLRLEVEPVHQKVDQLFRVARNLNLLLYFLFLEDVEDGRQVCVEGVPLVQHFRTPTSHLWRSIAIRIHLLQDVNVVVEHVGALEQLQPALVQVDFIIDLQLCEELQQREHHVPVQVGRDRHREIVLCHGCLFSCGDLENTCNRSRG